MDLKAYRRGCLLGALGALLVLVGDLCLSVIPANAVDSGLFVREAYLTADSPPGGCRCLFSYSSRPSGKRSARRSRRGTSC